MSSAVIQSYVYYSDDKAFLVSTINRESSSMEPHTYAETIVWEWNPETRKRGAFVGQGEHGTNSIYTHQAFCKQLHETGALDE